MIEVLDFYADWCGPCKAIAPTIAELEAEYDGKVIFRKINVDEDSETSIEYNVRGIPTIIFLKDGKIADKQIGAVAKHVLNKKIDALLES